MTSIPSLKFQGLQIGYSRPSYSEGGQATLILTPDDQVTFAESQRGSDAAPQNLAENPELRPSFIEETKRLHDAMAENAARNEGLPAVLKKFKSQILAAVDDSLQGLGFKDRTAIADEVITLASGRVNETKRDDKAFFFEKIAPSLEILLDNLPIDATIKKQIIEAMNTEAVYVRKTDADSSEYRISLTIPKTRY